MTWAVKELNALMRCNAVVLAGEILMLVSFVIGLISNLLGAGAVTGP